MFRGWGKQKSRQIRDSSKEYARRGIEQKRKIQNYAEKRIRGVKRAGTRADRALGNGMRRARGMASWMTRGLIKRGETNEEATKRRDEDNRRRKVAMQRYDSGQKNSRLMYNEKFDPERNMMKNKIRNSLNRYTKYELQSFGAPIQDVLKSNDNMKKQGEYERVSSIVNTMIKRKSEPEMETQLRLLLKKIPNANMARGRRGLLIKKIRNSIPRQITVASSRLQNAVKSNGFKPMIEMSQKNQEIRDLKAKVARLEASKNPVVVNNPNGTKAIGVPSNPVNSRINAKQNQPPP